MSFVIIPSRDCLIWQSYFLIMRQNFKILSSRLNQRFSSESISYRTFSLKNRAKRLINNLKFRLRSSRRNPVIVLGIGLLVVFIATLFSARVIIGRFSEDRISPPKAIAQQQLNKSFDFPIRDSENTEVAKVLYEIERASLQNSFIYQGKLAKSVIGRTFLIFDLKITNEYIKAIQINTRDYIRIKVNNSEELLAPEIHNDPVEIQADSTKYTRIGIPINETDKNIVLYIGELQGEKQEIKLNF